MGYVSASMAQCCQATRLAGVVRLGEHSGLFGVTFTLRKVTEWRGAGAGALGADAPSSTEVLPYFFVEAFECGCSTLIAVAM